MGFMKTFLLYNLFFESGIGARDIIETGNWVREFELRQKWLFFMNGEAI